MYAGRELRIRKRRWPRILILTLALLCLGLVLLPGILIPLLAPSMLAERIKEALGSHVAIEAVTGGWRQPFEISNLVIKESEAAESPLLARVATARANVHLYDVLFSDQPLRLTLRGFQVEFSSDETGSFNAHRFLDRLNARSAEDGDDSDSSLAFDRPLHLEITEGLIHILPADKRIRIDASASWSGAASDPVEFLMTWGDRQTPALNVGARIQHLLDDEDPIGNLRVEFAQLDLAPWTKILRASAGVSPTGTISRGTITGTFDGAEGSSLAVDMKLEGFHVPDVDLAGADLTRQLHVQVRASREPGRFLLEEARFDFANGFVGLQSPGRFVLGRKRAQGDLHLTASLPNAEQVGSALTGLIPDGWGLAGVVNLDLNLSGELDLAPGRKWNERLSDVTARIDASSEEVKTPVGSVKAITVEASLEKSLLTVERLEAEMLSGSVLVAGSLALSGEESRGDLTWRLQAPILIDERVSSGLAVQAVLRGSGILARSGPEIVFAGAVGADTLRIRKRKGELEGLDLRNARSSFSLSFQPGPAELSVRSLSFSSDQCELAIVNSVLKMPSAGTARAAPSFRGSFSGGLRRPVLEFLASRSLEGVDSIIVKKGFADLTLHRDWARDGQLSVKAVSPRIQIRGVDYLNFEADLDLPLAPAGNQQEKRVTLAASAAMPGSGKMVAIAKLGFASLMEGNGPGPGDHLRLTLVDVSLPPIFSAEQLVSAGGKLSRGLLSGDVKVDRLMSDTVFNIKLECRDLQLSRGGAIVSALPSAAITGTVRQTGNGDNQGLDVQGLTLIGDDLSIIVNRVKVEPLSGPGRTMEFDAIYSGEGAWLRPFLSGPDSQGILPLGRAEVGVRIKVDLDDPFSTARARVALQIAALEIMGRPLTDVTFDGSFKDGRLVVASAGFRHGSGVARMTGVVGMAPRYRKTEDRLTLDLETFPVEVLESYEDQRGRGEVLTRCRLSGRVALRGEQSGRLLWMTHLQAKAPVREMIRAGLMIKKTQLPALTLRADGIIDDQNGEGMLNLLLVTGKGVRVKLKDSTLTSVKAGHKVTANYSATLEPAVTRALIMDRWGDDNRVDGVIVLVGAGAAIIEEGGNIPMGNVTTSGRLAVRDYVLAGLAGQRMVGDYRFKENRLRLGPTSFLSLGGGRVALSKESTLTLAEEGVVFDVSLEVKKVKLDSRKDSSLGVANPVFLLLSRGTAADERSGVSGILDGQLQIGGVYSGKPGWSQSVDGRGRFSFTKGRVVGSSLLLNLGSKAPLLLPAPVANVIGTLAGRAGVPAAVFTGLGRDGFNFEDVHAGIVIARGQVRSDKDLALKSDQVTLTVNGYGTLEGEVNYMVRSDILHRIRGGTFTDLPGKLPVFGAVMSMLNPAKLLNAFEFGASITGNVFEEAPDGASAVTVSVTVHP